ncbi:phage tail tape measure protein [Reyranella sp.]|uniref:phage tail tape measure protein n=1 Tax=Reyranella sp. TaxID=1929291 RepID=UPI00403575DB
MDISNLVDYEQLFALELKHPKTDEPLGITFQIRSSGSERAKEVQRKHTAVTAAAERVVSAHTVATTAAAAAARVAANDNIALAASVLRMTGAYKLAGAAAGALASVLSIRSFIKETESIDKAFGDLSKTWTETFDLGKEAATPLRNAIEDLTIAIENPAFTGFVQLIGRVLFAALTLAVQGVTALVEGFNWLIENIKTVSVLLGGPVLAALNLISAAFEEVFGVGLFEIVKNSVNFLIGAFVAAYGDIKFLFSNIGDVISAALVGAVNAAIRSINEMVSAAAKGINEVIAIANKLPGVSIDPVGTGGPLKELDNPAASRLSGAAAARGAQQQKELSANYLGDFGGYLTNNLGRRPYHDDPPPPDKDKAGRGGADDPYAKLIQGAQNYIAAKKAETEAVGMAVGAAARLVHEQELLNKAATAGLQLSPAQIEQVKALAGAMAEADAAFKSAKFMDDAVKKSNEFIAAQEIERETLYMSTEAAMAYRIEKELLNKATADGVVLFDEYKAKIHEIAAAQAAAAEKTRQAKEWADFERATFKGFFADLNQGLRQGQTVWEAFGNAGLNALQKISDKLLEMAANKLFDQAFGGSGGGGGGFLSGLIGSIFGGGGGASAGSGFTFAQGAAFQAGNVIPFAAGGIVDGATTFAMSRGRTGVMGEAGPEAIMPLTRGPDGKLGVQMHGGGGAASESTTVIVNQTVHVGEFVTTQQFASGLRGVKKAAEQGARDGIVSERKRGGLKSVFR